MRNRGHYPEPNLVGSAYGLIFLFSFFILVFGCTSPDLQKTKADMNNSVLEINDSNSSDIDADMPPALPTDEKANDSVNTEDKDNANSMQFNVTSTQLNESIVLPLLPYENETENEVEAPPETNNVSGNTVSGSILNGTNYTEVMHKEYYIFDQASGRAFKEIEQILIEAHKVNNKTADVKSVWYKIEFYNLDDVADKETGIPVCIYDKEIANAHCANCPNGMNNTNYHDCVMCVQCSDKREDQIANRRMKIKFNGWYWVILASDPLLEKGKGGTLEIGKEMLYGNLKLGESLQFEDKNITLSNFSRGKAGERYYALSVVDLKTKKESEITDVDGDFNECFIGSYSKYRMKFWSTNESNVVKFSLIEEALSLQAYDKIYGFTCAEPKTIEPNDYDPMLEWDRDSNDTPTLKSITFELAGKKIPPYLNENTKIEILNEYVLTYEDSEFRVKLKE